MKISLVPSDSVAVVAGDARIISFAGIDPTVHAVQFDTAKAKGHVEFLADMEPRLENEEITDFAPYQVYVDRWVAAAPPPPPPPGPVVIDPIDELRVAMKADPTLLDKLKAV